MIIKRLSFILLSSFLTLTLLLGGNAHATSTVSFVGGAENFVFSPTSDLFGNLKDLAPGDTRTEDIIVKNIATDYDFIKIYLRTAPDDSLSDLLSRLTLKVYQDGNLLSSASASAALTEDYELGSFEPGKDTTLTIELTAPLALGNAYQHTTGDIAWIFTAEAYKDGQPVAPNTGAATATPGAANETIVIVAASALVLAMLLATALLARKKTRG